MLLISNTADSVKLCNRVKAQVFEGVVARDARSGSTSRDQFEEVRVPLISSYSLCKGHSNGFRLQSHTLHKPSACPRDWATLAVFQWLSHSRRLAHKCMHH